MRMIWNDMPLFEDSNDKNNGIRIRGPTSFWWKRSSPRVQERAGATHKVGTLLPSHVFFRRGATAQNPQGCDESCAGTDGGQGIIIVKWNRPINVVNVAMMFERSVIEQTSSARATLATLIGRFHFTITVSTLWPLWLLRFWTFQISEITHFLIVRLLILLGFMIF